MVPRNLKVSTEDTMLVDYCEGYCEYRGASPEVHFHLHSLEQVDLQMVLTTPEGQLFHLPLLTVLDETNDCHVIFVFHRNLKPQGTLL